MRSVSPLRWSITIRLPSPKRPYYSHPRSTVLSSAGTSKHLQTCLTTTTTCYCLPRLPGLSAADTSEHLQTSLLTWTRGVPLFPRHPIIHQCMRWRQKCHYQPLLLSRWIVPEDCLHHLEMVLEETYRDRLREQLRERLRERLRSGVSISTSASTKE